MVRETYDYMKKYQMIERGDGVLLGLSGGADSVCLLHVLHRLKGELGIELRAAHIHHGLRGDEAERDALFSEKLCRELDIPFKMLRIYADREAKENGISIEEAGRRARYRILEEEANAWETERRNWENAAKRMQVRIATAHHGNDSAETILFNLFRGTGLRGLSGIGPVRGRIIRPLLWTQRGEIVTWLREKKLDHVEDSSNQENEYTRNRLRNEILPAVLSKVNAQAIQNIIRAGERAGEADGYLEKKAGEWIREHVSDGQTGFFADELLAEDRILRSYVIRRMIQNAGCPLKDITARHIDGILGLLEKETGKMAELPHGITARNEYGKIWIDFKQNRRESGADNLPALNRRNNAERMKVLPHVDFQIFPSHNQQEIPKNQYTKWFDYDRIKDTLSVRNRRIGDYIMLASGGRKTVKAFMIDEKIPREMRDEIPLLAEGNHVLWIVGYRISEYYKVTEQTKNILQVHLDGGTDNG